MGRRIASVFIDGFNLYHAIDGLGTRGDHNYLKWVSLRSLSEVFVPRSDYTIRRIRYFSAYAVHRPGAYKRHRAFVSAQRAVGVEPIMGRFKEKDRNCFSCGRTWKAHEEKQTDVNIAIHALGAAFKDEFDTAVFITADSDMVPVVRMIKEETGKVVRLIFPIGLNSSELTAAAGGPGSSRRMTLFHLQRSLLPPQVRDASGRTVASRPAKYRPPGSHT